MILKAEDHGELSEDNRFSKEEKRRTLELPKWECKVGTVFYKDSFSIETVLLWE